MVPILPHFPITDKAEQHTQLDRARAPPLTATVIARKPQPDGRMRPRNPQLPSRRPLPLNLSRQD